MNEIRVMQDRLRKDAPGFRLEVQKEERTNEIRITLSSTLTSVGKLSEEMVAMYPADVVGLTVDTMVQEAQQAAIEQLGLMPTVERLAKQQAEGLFRERIKELKDAWTNPGENPQYHYDQKALLFKVWNPLARQLSRLFGP